MSIINATSPFRERSLPCWSNPKSPSGTWRTFSIGVTIPIARPSFNPGWPENLRDGPLPCRGYDCRKDKRIWLDFEQRIPNPAVERPDWLEVVSQNDTDREPQGGSNGGDLR